MNYKPRQIKFRVFFFDGEDYASGEMITAQEAHRENYIEFDDWGELVATDEDSDNPCSIIMQFTGIQDKDGKDVYEGDVISKAGAYVLYDNKLASFCFQFKDSKTPATPLFYNHESFTILGNIYENPELIKI